MPKKDHVGDNMGQQRFLRKIFDKGKPTKSQNIDVESEVFGNPNYLVRNKEQFLSAKMKGRQDPELQNLILKTNSI